jgi:hypothetical protein
MNARKPAASAPAAVPMRMEVARDIAARLSKSTDALNTRLILAEKDLAALGLGVSGWVNISDAEDHQTNACTMLGFQKSGADWKLFVSKGTNDFDNFSLGDETPLLKAPKVMRIRAAQHLGELLDHLITCARRQLDDVEKAVAVVSEVLRGAMPGNPQLNDDFGDDAKGDDEIPF